MLVSKSFEMEPVVEVLAKATRRRFTGEYKKRIVELAARCKKPGELGALLRSEGLYSSHLAKWRQDFASGGRCGLEAKRRGPKPSGPDARDKKLLEQEREIARLRKRAERAEELVALQKKSPKSWVSS